MSGFAFLAAGLPAVHEVAAEAERPPRGHGIAGLSGLSIAEGFCPRQAGSAVSH
jgi:hypothetical protein